MPDQLFRKSAQHYLHSKNQANLLMGSAVPGRYLTAIFVFFTLLAICFLGSNDYQRKQPVTGEIRADKGIITIYPAAGGIITRIHVASGQQVKAGEKLLDMRMDQAHNGNAYVVDQNLRVLEQAQQKSLQDLQRLEQKLKVQLTAKHIRTRFLLDQVEAMGKLVNSNAALLELKQQALGRSQQLFSTGMISPFELDLVREQFFQQQANYQQQTVNLLAARSELEELEQDLQLLQYQKMEKQTQIESAIAQLELDKSALQSQGVNSIRAPVDGHISNLYINEQMTVQGEAPLADLLPLEYNLRAEFMVPGEAVGFLQAGQQVNLRIDAFPYQKFGTYQATIAEVSPAGLNEPSGQQATGQNQRLFRVIAGLDYQFVEAYGKPVPLRAGMEVQADVTLDKRSLLQWLLEPLFSLSGKA